MLDVKILAKVLARRLENILPAVISEDQTGFVKNRYSYFNIHRLFDILYLPSGVTPGSVYILAIGFSVLKRVLKNKKRVVI